MPTLLKLPHLVVEHHSARRFVRVSRTEQPFANVAEIKSSFDRCVEVLAPLAPGALGLLYDTRMSPMSTDPELLRALVDISEAVFATFPRVAIVTRTPLGNLQVNRLRKTGTVRPEVFGDEEAAIAWLLSPL